MRQEQSSAQFALGLFVLGEAGLLDGRTATTHWTHSEIFAQRFKNVQVDIDKLIINDGDVITAGGMMAWVDLGLNLIERFISPAIMVATARYFLADAAGREQRFYSSFAPRMHHGDGAIVKIQRWLQIHQVENLTVRAMASRARLSERTFLRRFQSATGLPPTEYVQHLRVDKARERLSSHATCYSGNCLESRVQRSQLLSKSLPSGLSGLHREPIAADSVSQPTNDRRFSLLHADGLLVASGKTDQSYAGSRNQPKRCLPFGQNMVTFRF